jgi:predicted GIY-YIG superfamily endonuclease
MLYILEFQQPLGNPNNSRAMARYYVGYCKEGRLEERLAEHRAGRGANITRAAAQRGIPFEVVATAPGYREEEIRLKATKNIPSLIRRLRQQAARNHSNAFQLRLVKFEQDES